MTDLRTIKREILKDHHIAQLFTAVLSALTVRLLGEYFAGIVVAKLPFSMYGFLNNLIAYKLNDCESNCVSAPFLFVLIFLTFKQFARKSLMLNAPRILP